MLAGDDKCRPDGSMRSWEHVQVLNLAHDDKLGVGSTGRYTD